VAAIIPLINYFFISTKDAEVLADRLKSSTGAHGLEINLFNDADKIDDILVEEALITAWDLNERSPRTFSKWAYKALAGDAQQVSNLKLIDMIQASGTTPAYFRPSTLKCVGECAAEHLYVSGDSIALSPAFYAYLHANEMLKIAPERISVVSVGNINELAEDIGT